MAANDDLLAERFVRLGMGRSEMIQRLLVLGQPAQPDAIFDGVQ
jgi:hypothetical protein